MQLGAILQAARNRPAVTRPVKFTLAATNAGAQPTSVEVEAVLAYVDEEVRAAMQVEATVYLAEQFPGKPITATMHSNELAFRLLAAALRDKADPVKPLCESGVAQLRPGLLYTVAEELSDQYRKFIADEYPVSPSPKDIAAMKADAAGE